MKLSMPRSSFAVVFALLSACGGSSSNDPQLPDPLPPDSTLTASLPLFQRIATDNPTGGELLSLVGIAPSLYFVHGGETSAQSRIDVDYLRSICQTFTDLAATVSELHPGDRIAGLQVDTASNQMFIVPSQMTGIGYIIAPPRNIDTFPEFQTKPKQCWTEARVRVSGSAAVQVGTTYIDVFAGTVRQVVVGTSAWRTVRDEWITIRTGR